MMLMYRSWPVNSSLWKKRKHHSHTDTHTHNKQTNETTNTTTPPTQDIHDIFVNIYSFFFCFKCIIKAALEEKWEIVRCGSERKRSTGLGHTQLACFFSTLPLSTTVFKIITTTTTTIIIYVYTYTRVLAEMFFCFLSF